MTKPKISAIVIVQNEERHLRECLTSVAWADEIVVVDGGSTDRTVEIAREITQHVYENPWPGFAAQKRFALQKATMPWVLSIDADERVPAALRDEIFATLSKNDAGVSGYYLPRLSTFLGKFIYNAGWYPGYQLRLFERQKTAVIEASVHEGFQVQGELGHLQNHLLHFTHDSLEQSFARLNRYSSLEARDRTGRKKVRWWDFLTHPGAAFFNKFFALRGYRDGLHGFVLAVITALVKMALYMKIWELQRQQK